MQVSSFTALLSLALAPAVFPQTPPPSRVEGKGAQVRVPPGWKFNKGLLVAGGPIALTNFAETYGRGGVLPTGGAEIEITSVPRPIELAGYARAELKGVQQLRLEELTSNGKPALRVSYSDEIADGIATRNLVYYVPQGTRLYKFYLTFGSGDPHERELIETLVTIVREAILK